MFKRMYYLVTISETNLGLEIYKLGRFTKNGIREYGSKLSKEFPFLFVIFSGWGLKSHIANTIRLRASDIAGVPIAGNTCSTKEVGDAKLFN